MSLFKGGKDMNTDLCEPVPDGGFLYSFNGIGLDTPDMVTGPVIQNSSVGAGTTFILFWNTPSTPTQDAIASSNAGPMEFLAADGTQVSAQVAMSSMSSDGSLVASITILEPTSC
jgi:hypothetical protein